MLPLERWVHTPDVNFGASANAKGGSASQQKGILYHRRFYATLKMHCAVGLSGSRLLVEPWFKAVKSQTIRSPDAVLIDDAAQHAYVIEVKLNWADGRDGKLIDEYLGIVKSAFGLAVSPLLVTANLRGYKHPPLLGLGQLEQAKNWKPGQPTPLLLWLR